MSDPHKNDDQSRMDTPGSPVDSLTAPTDEASSWRCFHCDEIFTDKAEAKEHFGSEEWKTPACRLSAEDVKRLRELEADNARLCRENDHLENDSRLYHELDAEVQRRTNGHGLYMYLDYLEGEKLVLQEEVARLKLAAGGARRETPPPTQIETAADVNALSELLTDLREALAERPAPGFTGICMNCGTDFANEARLNRMVLSGITTRLRKALPALPALSRPPHEHDEP